MKRRFVRPDPSQRIKNPCEYNPEKKAAAFENEVHAQATMIVGAKGQWRLCASCAALPEFRRFKTRVFIR